jgi:adenosylcobinamide kinase/adenosylcobinamide-phosphate guanylyltransferase
VPVTFITGPVRSGKSRFAERLARESGLNVTYLATARRDDDDAEWVERIARHRRSRPQSWETIETAGLTVDALRELLASQAASSALVVDSLGTWLAAEMSARLASGGESAALDVDALERNGTTLVDALLACPARAFVVGEEVGWGLVPTSSAGRAFRDVLGRLQQRLAGGAAVSYLVVAGFALDLTAAARRVDDDMSRT